VTVIAPDEDFTLSDLYGHMTCYEARIGDRASGGYNNNRFQHSANNTSHGGDRRGFGRGGGGCGRGDGGRGNNGGHGGNYGNNGGQLWRKLQ
jgi:hypothetical protein